MHLFKKIVDIASLPACKNHFTISSPLAGKVLSLEEATDPLFATRLFGDGVLIEPAGFQLIAPFAGRVIDISSMANQVILCASNGLQLMVQLGFDSHLMMGLGFKSRVKKNQKFESGDVLLEFDLNHMKRQLSNVQCPVTIINSEKLKAIVPHYYKVLAGQDKLMTVYW